jgi:osmoprotectant transport system ATP-binding protein
MIQRTSPEQTPSSPIEFRHVFFRRPERAVEVLRDFSLRIAAGEVLALVGRSGAGKTTVLKLINRLLLPDAGDVIVATASTRAWDPIALRRSVGYVIQEGGLFPHLSVADNIAVVPRLLGWDEPRVQQRVEELLNLIGLAAELYAARWPDELSGGERQRVGVARALAADPPILLMDEPFGALDPITRADLHAEFRRVQTRVGKTVVIVTHDIGEALALADRVAVVEDGLLIADETPAAIVESTDARVRRLLDAVIAPARR